MEPVQLDAIIGGQHNHRIALEAGEAEELKIKILENFSNKELEKEMQRRVAEKI